MKRGLLFLVACLLTGCTRTVYVPVESVRTEYRDVHTRDSIHLRDSVFVMLKGDTLRIEKYKTLYRDRLVRDSIFVNDTIRVPYPVEKLVYRNRIYWYQKLLMGTGAAVFLLLGWKILRK